MAENTFAVSSTKERGIPFLNIDYSMMKKKGKTIYMSERKHSHQETPKIIINGFGVKYVYFDKIGEYGVTDTPFILLTDNENIYNMLTTTLWNFIVNALGILGNNLNGEAYGISLIDRMNRGSEAECPVEYIIDASRLNLAKKGISYSMIKKKQSGGTNQEGGTYEEYEEE